MVPGLFAHSERYSLLYSSFEMSTKAEEYTGGGTWHAWYLRWYLECMVPGMVPGMYVHSYVCYAWSTKTVEYTRGGRWDACTLTTDPEAIDWCWGVHWTAWHVWLPKRENVDIGKVTILSSGTGTSVDINFLS